MNVALMGSVSSSWHALDALIRGGVEVTGVLGVDESQAERISDYRSLRALASRGGIPFHSFVKVSEPGVESFLKAHAPDLLWVIGLSQLVPQRLIKIARAGGVGFHPTMLPEGRGRAPVAWTILLGARAAANLFFLTDEPDAGDIIVQREVPVLPDDYSEDLIHRTNLALAEAILELAPRLRSGDIPRTPQDHSKATYYAKRTPADGRIDWSATTDQVYRLIRAAGRPYPGAFTHYQQRKLTIWRAQPAQLPHETGASKPGCALALTDAGHVLVAAGDGALRLTEVEIEGGGRVADILEPGARLS
jgi:methionyl-tRNA formyltransferase